MLRLTLKSIKLSRYDCFCLFFPLRKWNTLDTAFSFKKGKVYTTVQVFSINLVVVYIRLRMCVSIYK